MKVLVSEKLSEHKYKTPEGYLVCTDAILARTGKQTYTKDEVFGDGDSTEIDVDRPYDQVMNEKTIASFENKPVTFDHPEEDVNVGNYKDYAIGYVRDVHQGKTDKGEDVIIGNLVITDQDAIDAIEQGDHTDLSCGYDCDIKDDDKGGYMQTNIRGNHVALCEQGRAGNARIVDSKTHAFSRLKDSYVIEELPEDETADIYVPILKKYNLKIQKLSGNKVKVIGNRNDIVRYYDKEIGIDEDDIGIEDSKVNDDNRLVRMSKSLESREFSSYFEISYLDSHGRFIASPDVFYKKAEYDAIIAYAKKLGKPITYFKQSSYTGDSKMKDFDYPEDEDDADITWNKGLYIGKKSGYNRYAVSKKIDGKYHKWGVHTQKELSRLNLVEDSEANDMAQRVYKFSTNIPALKRAISNGDKEEVKSMLATLKKDKEDFEEWDEQGQMSNFDRKTFEKTMSEVMPGIKKIGFTIDSKPKTTVVDALKILHVAGLIK